MPELGQQGLEEDKPSKVQEESRVPLGHRGSVPRGGKLGLQEAAEQGRARKAKAYQNSNLFFKTKEEKKRREKEGGKNKTLVTGGDRRSIFK